MKILPYQRQYCSQYCTYTTDVREVHRVQWHVCSLHCKYWSLPHWMMAESEEEEKDATVLRWCIGPVATDGDCYWKRVDRNNSPKSVGLQRGASTVFLQPQRHLKSTVRKKTVQQSRGHSVLPLPRSSPPGRLARIAASMPHRSEGWSPRRLIRERIRILSANASSPVPLTAS